MLFSAVDNSGTRKLFKMDGTTTAIEAISDVSPQNLTVSGTRAFFTYEGNLWRTNGTATGTALVKKFYGYAPESLTDVNGTLFFSGRDEWNTRELFKSTGTFASTVRVKDIYPGSQGSFPMNLVNLNGTLFFVANHPTYGASLWKSDGTEAGTVVVQAANPEHKFEAPRELVAAGNQLFFTAYNRAMGLELYKTDGTPAGTVLVADIRQNDVSATGYSWDIENLRADGNKVFFHANVTEDWHKSLWVSDGTESGTSVIADLADVMYLRSLNGLMYFATPDNTRERLDLYSTNGTAEGTTFIKTVDISSISSSAVLNNVLYFVGPGYFGGTSDMWRTDGTACGTFVVPSEMGYGVRITSGPLVINKDRRLVFPGFSPSVGAELFKLDKALAPKSPCGTPVIATSDGFAEVLPTTLDKDITSAPNPFSDRFTLRVDAPEDKSYDAAILNVNGKEMSSLQDLRTNQDYEVGGELRTGMYLIKIQLGNRIEVRRMIKTQ